MLAERSIDIRGNPEMGRLEATRIKLKTNRYFNILLKSEGFNVETVSDGQKIL